MNIFQLQEVWPRLLRISDIKGKSHSTRHIAGEQCRLRPRLLDVQGDLGHGHQCPMAHSA